MPPDPDALSFCQRRARNHADTIYHAAGVPVAIHDRARRDAVRVVGMVPEVLPVGRAITLRLSSNA